MSNHTPERDTLSPDPSAEQPQRNRERPMASVVSAGTAVDGVHTGQQVSPRPGTDAEPGRPEPGRPEPERSSVPAGPDPAPATRSMPAAIPTADGSPTPQGADPAWSQLQSQFVDDPTAAVRGASDLVEQAVQRLLRRSGEHDTEELRTAFLRYRDLHRSLTSL
jgi:hypothetical protein